MNRHLPSCLLACATLLVPTANAELQGTSLQGGARLNDKDKDSSGLQGGRLQTSGLQGGGLKTSSLEGAKLEGIRAKQGAECLSSAAIKLKATELAQGGFGVEKVQGAFSNIPRTQVGELLYDAAGLMSLMGEEMSEVVTGYYMAVLADPEGKRHDAALARLLEIFLAKDLDHKKAVRLYDGGLETMKGLVDIKIGLTAEGHQASLRSLQVVRAAYQHRRKQDVDVSATEDAESVASQKIIDAPHTIALPDPQREDAGKHEPEP